MNYRHAYHAGNFADVLKHLILTRCILHLQKKDKAFRVVDTHAGTGLYDLSSDEAQRTGEWRGGIGRVLEAEPHLPSAIRTILQPWLDAVRAENGGENLMLYPGSPRLARRLFRPQDRLEAVERHPADSERLKALFAGDHQARIIALDGWLALGGHLPPKEKRGLVLIDPPFEEPGEFDRMIVGLDKALKRWRGGTYLLWYPIKDRAAVAAFRAQFAELAEGEGLDVSLEIRPASPPGTPHLDGCGVALVNPPFTLAGEMRAVLPVLSPLLSEDGKARFGVETR